MHPRAELRRSREGVESDSRRAAAEVLSRKCDFETAPLSAAELHQRACELFDLARHAAPDARAVILASHAAGDAALLAEVESLLAAHDRARGFLSQAALELPELADVPAPEWIDDFRVLSLLGRGGMSAVYLAEQRSPRRPVALKVLLPGTASPSRALTETRALARLQHPGIAQIYSAGLADWGAGRQPYFAMEWIRGRPLIEAADALRLDVRGRVELLARVARAVHYAHEHGVIHRDLKPSNILVDESGAPKVLDFGIARVLGETGAIDDATATQSGEVLGTPAYMSPEQLGGRAHAADARSDVYALGLVAYELLSGRRARPTPPPGANPIEEFRRAEPAALAHVAPSLRGDLDAVVVHALEHEPERRYATALDFAEDCERFLQGDSVRARRPSTLRQGLRFARRHRVFVAALAAAFVALAAGTVGSVQHARTVEHERNLALDAKWKAEREAERALAMFEIARENKNSLQATHDFLQSMLASVGANQLGADARVSDVLARASAELQGAYPDAPEVEISLQYTLALSYSQLGLELEAEAHFRRARDLMILSRGERDADVVRATVGIAQILMRAQRLEEAAPLIERALELAALPEVSCEYDARRTAREYANLLIERGEFRRAEALLVQAIERAEADGRNDDVLARLMLTLADSLYQHQDYEGSLAWNLRARDVHRAAGTQDTSFETSMLTGLAGSMRKTGRVEEALAIFAELLPRMNEVFGPNHKNTIAITNNYALALGDAGRCEESSELLERVWSALRERLGESHVSTLGALNNLADQCIESGEYERAHALYDRWLRVARSSPAGRHPSMVMVRNSIAMFLMGQRRLPQALEVCDELVALGSTVLADDELANAYFEGRLGWVLHQLGRDDEALVLMERCVAVLDRLRGGGGTLDKFWRDTLAEVRAVAAAPPAELEVATR